MWFSLAPRLPSERLPCVGGAGDGKDYSDAEQIIMGGESNGKARKGTLSCINVHPCESPSLMGFSLTVLRVWVVEKTTARTRVTM